MAPHIRAATVMGHRGGDRRYLEPRFDRVQTRADLVELRGERVGSRARTWPAVDLGGCGPQHPTSPPKGGGGASVGCRDESAPGIDACGGRAAGRHPRRHRPPRRRLHLVPTLPGPPDPARERQPRSALPDLLAGGGGMTTITVTQPRVRRTDQAPASASTGRRRTSTTSTARAPGRASRRSRRSSTRRRSPTGR